MIPVGWTDQAFVAGEQKEGDYIRYLGTMWAERKMWNCVLGGVGMGVQGGVSVVPN